MLKSSRTSGAMYSGVPQVLLLTDCMTSFFENPKSHSLSCGRGHGPCSSMLSSCGDVSVHHQAGGYADHGDGSTP